MNYKDLLSKMKKLPTFESLTMSSIPGYSQSKGDSMKKRLNKLDLERDKLITWMRDYKIKNKEHPKTTLDFYLIGRILGKGAFGKVNLAVHKLSGKLVAIKSLHKNYLASEGNNVKFKNEIALLRLLKHKNVMRLYETFSTDKYLLIVMELCSGGDLLTYVRKRRRISEPVAKVIFKELMDGLKYCHEKGIVHRDIKLDNILLDELGHVKIGDFGVSKKTAKGKLMYDRCGTPAYIAPEMLTDKGYEGEKVDVWSAGVVLYTMIYGNFPFKADNVEELENLITAGSYTLPDDISVESRSLLLKIFDQNPLTRLSIDQVLAHPWLKDINPHLPIFTHEEIEAIKNEYRFKGPTNDSLNSSESISSIFTEHKLDTMENEAENDLNQSKSTVLAPFNSLETEQERFIRGIERGVQPKKMLKFSSKLREYDRRYERNNNSQLDNGVYVQPVGGASPKGFGNNQNKPSASTSTPSTPGQVSPCSKEKAMSHSGQKKDSKKKVDSETTQSVHGRPHGTAGIVNVIDNEKGVLQKMERIGFEKAYVLASLSNNDLNSATTLYYLLTNYY